MAPLVPSQDVGTTFTGALFYGLYLATLFHCIRWLVFSDEGWKLRKKINRTILTITLAIWFLSTVNKVLEVGSAMQEVTPVQIPTEKSLSEPKALPWGTAVVCTGANVTTLLADAVLIYRCWVIYGKSRRVVVFPIFFWFGGIMLTALQAYGQIVQSALILKAWQPVNRFADGPGSILTPFWLCTIMINMYATAMIARRIYLVTKASKTSVTVHRLQFTMRILVESGFLYLTTTLAHFVVWFTPNTYAISVISGMNLSIEGIAYNLILIRAAQARVEEAKQENIEHISDLQFNVRETTAHSMQVTSQVTGLPRGENTAGAMVDNNSENTSSLAHSFNDSPGV